ncbi:MAG TPA: furin-like repeat-containing protein, partial [Polyangiaceae bacterium]|nr:furin-like repeat-containing protein [Polyangiaceae bacterium]
MEHPETLLELAKGREYLFQSCSNGAAAGSTARGTEFGLTLDGDSQGPGGTVTAQVPLGRGCDGTLSAPLSPAQSVEMLQAFDWSATTALPETNADGTPTLFYVNIYIRNETERELLDRFLIHYSGKPFFADELDVLYKGKCGSVDLSGDGNGLFVFAMLPGKTYNRIRAAVSNGDIRPEERVLFQAIVLRDPPAAMKNADGSIDYAGLKETGFYYLGVRELPVDAALDHTALPGGAAKNFIDAIEFVATVARDAGRGVIDVLGEIDRALQGEVTVHLDIDVYSNVRAFSGRAMQRGWGPDAGSEAGLRGVRVEIMQWAQTGLPLFTSYFAHTNRDGKVSVRVAKGSDGEPHGAAGLCMDMENNAGQLTHFLLANSICDFRGLDVSRIVDENPVPTAFGNFQQETNVLLTTTHSEFQILSEVSNGSDYLRDVVGTRVRQPRILTGSNAAVLSPGKAVPWVGCFGFPNALTDTVFFATIGIPVAGFYISVLTTTDMVIPPAAEIDRSYGVMVHEYGHYALCGIIDNYAESPTLTFTTLLSDIAAEGSGGPTPNPEPEDTSRVIHEAFADFIAGQVVGGADYFSMTGAVKNLGGMDAYCDGSGSNCWDENLSSRATGDDSIGRLATLFHDAFDGHAWRTLAPTNGDIWEYNGTTNAMTLATTAYGDAADEQVVLGGPRLNDVIDVFLVENLLQSTRDDGFPDFSFRTPALETALGSVVLLEHSWCQACNLFLPHWTGTAGMSQFQLWEGCRDEPRIVNAIGSPPASDVRFDVRDCSHCAADQISGVNGCEVCPVGEYVSGNVCVACAPGSVPNADGCSACAANQVSSGNTCVDCPLGQGPDRTLNVCADCAIDATLDWSTVPDPACGSGILTQVSAPGDVCPDQFWVEVINLNGTSPDGRSSGFAIHVDLAEDIENAAECLPTEVRAELAAQQGSNLVPLSSAASTEATFCETGTGTEEFCLDGRCVHVVDLSLTSAEVSAGRTSVRIMGNALGSAGNLPAQVSIATTECIIEPP